MDYKKVENAIMACIDASQHAAELQGPNEADEAVRYAEAARTLAETPVTMKHVNET